eukprot:302964-Amphidinium_carterae.1
MHRVSASRAAACFACEVIRKCSTLQRASYRAELSSTVSVRNKRSSQNHFDDGLDLCCAATLIAHHVCLSATLDLFHGFYRQSKRRPRLSKRYICGTKEATRA